MLIATLQRLRISLSGDEVDWLRVIFEEGCLKNLREIADRLAQLVEPQALKVLK